MRSLQLSDNFFLSVVISQMEFAGKLLFLLVSSIFCSIATAACSNGGCQFHDKCSSHGDCAAGLFCFSCSELFSDNTCVRASATNQFSLINNSVPFNKYSFLASHNSFAIAGEPSHTGFPRLAPSCQEESVTDQLRDGVRALMLDTYDFRGDVWLCHSFDGKCFDFTAFGPAMDTLREVEAFLSANPTEIVTMILEDYVKTPNALTKVFRDSGLTKYWFPVKSMPQNGEDWPLVSDMVAKNQRLLVFTSDRRKQDSEGIAYQWNYMVENQYGDEGVNSGNCTNRGESRPLDDRTKSLVLVNYFTTAAVKLVACVQNSEGLLGMLDTCHAAAGNRWANFVAVNFFKRSDGGGAFQAVDAMNGELLCGAKDVHECLRGN